MEKTIIEALNDLSNDKMPLIIEDENEIQMKLDASCVQKDNMQINENAFEGWMFAIYSCAKNMHLDKKIKLTLKDEQKLKYEAYNGNGHLCRFLYRLMKYSEQYSNWFSLDDYLVEEVRKFKVFLTSELLTNNIESGKPGPGTSEYKEHKAEEWFGGEGQDDLRRCLVKDKIDIGNNPIYRQLPVGLFKDYVRRKKENIIFPENHAAIDLWTCNKDELNVIELKADNPMIGIMTEVFFYSNFMLDFVDPNGLFQLDADEAYVKRKSNSRGTFPRGHEHITQGFKKINGIMLADDNKYHPWVNSETLDIMNDNGDIGIKYFRGTYPYAIIPD